jgi:glutathione S-transferase
MLDLPFELVDIDMYGGEHKREPFLSLNPFGQMPAMEDGGFFIADSHACLVYLARKYDSSNQWLPSGAEGEAKVAEWLSKSANEVHQGPWMKRAKIRRPDAIKLADEEIDARCDHVLGIMNKHLGDRDWLALDHATIADISCYGPISLLDISGYDTGRWPAVRAWMARVASLPGAIDIDGAPIN